MGEKAEEAQRTRHIGVFVCKAAVDETLFGRVSRAWRYRRWLGDGGEQRLSEFSGELSKPDLEAVEFWGCDAYRLSSRGFDVFPTVNVRRCVRAKGCQLAALETQTVQYGRCCQM